MLTVMSERIWADGQAYERYVGRWSRLVAQEFVRWVRVRSGQHWLDAGCGTGALTETILTHGEPASVTGVDPSAGFISVARETVTDPRATFHVGNAQELPLADRSVDVAVCGLVLNFVPEPALALEEFARVLKPEGVVAAYVWDYAEGMEMMRHFWNAAGELDPRKANVDEGLRFPLCRPEPLRQLWSDAGLADITVTAIEIPTVFKHFDDYWTPFLGGQGPAPAYTMSLPDKDRDALRDLLRERLPVAADGTIALTARAWAIRATV